MRSDLETLLTGAGSGSDEEVTVPDDEVEW